MSEYYNEHIITKYESRIILCESEIKKYQKEIAKIKNDMETFKKSSVHNIDSDYNRGCRLTDIIDSKNILDNMKKNLSSEEFIKASKNLESLFWHVDNIRYTYDECKSECPEWFSKKYGHLFRK